MDMLAHEIGMDPVEFRLKECRKPSTESIAGVNERWRAIAAGKTRGERIGDAASPSATMAWAVGMATIRLTLERSGRVLLQTGLPDRRAPAR